MYFMYDVDGVVVQVKELCGVVVSGFVMLCVCYLMACGLSCVFV